MAEIERSVHSPRSPDRRSYGEHRVFGIEALSADALFVHLAGGLVPSLDTIYRDLRRFDEPAIIALEEMMAAHGLEPVRAKRRPIVHMDVDTTVEPLFASTKASGPGTTPGIKAARATTRSWLAARRRTRSWARSCR